MCRVSSNYMFVITQLCITLCTTFKTVVTWKNPQQRLPPRITGRQPLLEADNGLIREKNS
ncbi:hypothetical protein EU799_05750 [Corynebacterium silvaticum]|nr:hypothetical protein EU802_05570 [Corynebacterium silvaticum]TFA96481.1 hypothetical protein EU799_05750 [Corynebacterium silvaticum]TNX84464.1 hypothetical protein FIT55_07650 [Corynebacterium silvaticum]TRM16800.1 hypothetical protein ET810_004635 [Corynebacterium silvaticum]